MKKNIYLDLKNIEHSMDALPYYVMNSETWNRLNGIWKEDLFDECIVCGQKVDFSICIHVSKISCKWCDLEYD